MARVIHTRKGKYQYAYEHTREGDKVVSRYMYPVDDEGNKRDVKAKIAQQTTESKQAGEILIQQSIEKGTHNGYVKDGIYYTLTGDKIKKGDVIKMHFIGQPTNMEQPFKFVSAKNYYSTVGYNNNVEVIIKDVNGKQKTFREAHQYSIYKK